jgi:hypothetical protein
MTNMPDAELCIHDCSLNTTVVTDGNNVNNDIHCDKLQFELQKAKLEISSYEEILKLMQEEILVCADHRHSRLHLLREGRIGYNASSHR